MKQHVGVNGLKVWLSQVSLERGSRAWKLEVGSKMALGSRSPVDYVDPTLGVVAMLTGSGDAENARMIVKECRSSLRKIGVPALGDSKLFLDVNKVSLSDPKVIFELALSALTPSVELVSVKVGGSVYQVPRPIAPLRARHKAISWVVNAARAQVKGQGGSYFMRGHARANELLNVVEDATMLDRDPSYVVKSVSLNKKLALYRQVKVNRNYASMLFGGASSSSSSKPKTSGTK